MADDVIVIRTYGSEIEAQLAQAALAADGIPSIVLPDNAGGMLPSLQVLFPVRLAVRAEDAEAALATLDTPPGEMVENDGDEENGGGVPWEEDHD